MFSPVTFRTEYRTPKLDSPAGDSETGLISILEPGRVEGLAPLFDEGVPTVGLFLASAISRPAKNMARAVEVVVWQTSGRNGRQIAITIMNKRGRITDQPLRFR